MSSFDFEVEGLAGYLRRVDQKLKEQAPQDIGGLKRMLEASGKRWRPSLVIAVAFHSGKQIDERILTAATAVELVHIASLVHDDIIDGGNLRWGEPTINAREGIDSAILAGDYLLAKGCALASSVSAECGVILAKTIMRLCEGQAIEQKDNFNTERTEESLIKAIKGKTSSMFTAAVSLGGLVAELDSTQLKLLSNFAENLGVAYQYIDDSRDFLLPAELAGKSVGNDIREGNYTLPVILSLQGPNGDKLRKSLKQEAPFRF